MTEHGVMSVLLVVGIVVMVPATVWHYCGYWNGRYDVASNDEENLT